MSEGMNKELEGQVAAQEVAPEGAAAGKVTVEELMETVEDFAAGLKTSYQTLNKRKIELAKEENDADAKWAQSQQMMDDRTVVKVKISEAVKGGVVTTLEGIHVFTPASQLSTEYVGKLRDWQGKYVECIIITMNSEKKGPVLSGRGVEREREEAEEKARMEQFKARGVVEGTMDSIKLYRAFVRLVDGVDGFLHTSQISTQRIKHPGAALIEGQTVKVKIFSTESGKLNLSTRALSEQTAECEEHETFDYKGTGSVSIGLGDLLKRLKL